MDDAETWRWIWLAATVLLAAGELAVPGTFFLLSFALGAAIATVVAFVDGSLLAQWVCFLIGSGVGLALLVPLGRRLAAAETDEAVEGAGRWIGRVAEVLEEIPGGPHATGRVRVERDVWRAETDEDHPIAKGAQVEVLAVRGTRLVVARLQRESDPERASAAGVPPDAASDAVE
jgi:membrane protein implicated in regulation of membrane protease activity